MLQTEHDLTDRPMGTQLRNADGSLIYRTELDYDKQNRLVGFGEEAEGSTYKTSYTYDNDNRVTEIDFGGSNKVKYTYDNLGRVQKRIVENGTDAGKLTDSYEFVSGGHGTGSTTSMIAKINRTVLPFEYTYDNRGNIISEKRGTLTTTYTYDALGQLVRVDDPHENATWVYEYDRGGNMTKRKKYAYTTGSLDGLSYSLRSYTYDSTWKDQLVSNGSYPLTYDAMGNLSTYADWVYEWEGGRQLVKQTQNEKVVSYKYDHNGMRVSKTFAHTNGTVYAVTNYAYNGTKLVHMTKNSDVLHFFYDDQGRPAKVKYNGVMYTYLHNLQGDIVGIIDGNGTLVVEYKYNAWGTILSKTGSMVDTLGYLNPFRYRGYIFDEETWMYWLKSRYYYPELHRFINTDNLIAKYKSLLSGNTFSYCKNNPTMRIDANGKSSEWLFALRHPFVASHIGWYIEGKRCTNITTTAIRFAGSLKLKNSANKEGTQVNALRHTLWTGMISRFYGATIARKAVRSHEDKEMLRVGDSLSGKSVTEISTMVFDSHIKADSMCDMLNNEIALQMAWNKETPHEICSAVLGVYHNDGLWVINENMCGGEYSIYKERLSDAAYNAAMFELACLDDYGFSIE